MKLKKLYQAIADLFACKRNMYVLCASDRFNYGDLLFPFIIRHYFQDLVDELVMCSTTESDLSERGALPTKGFSVLMKMSPIRKNYLMIGGGECIFVDWQPILDFIKEDLMYDKGAFPTKYPFTIGRKEIPNLHHVMYNSVGCNRISYMPAIMESKTNKRILGSADYVSVRDLTTSQGIEKMQIPHYCCADSAILMSRLFSASFLNDHSSPLIKDIISKRYVFFQIALQHIKNDAKDYADALIQIIKEKGIHICMCPIGTALGHDDPQALSEVAKYLPSDAYTMISIPSLWDIMNLIRNAEIYVGSSLHGAITAMSFQVPLISFGPRKCQVYIDSWYDTADLDGSSFVSKEELGTSVIRRMESRVTLSPERQMQSVDESFSRMRKIIQDT